MMHSPFKYRLTLEDRLAFARRQEFHIKAATVISAILLAIGLGIAVRGDLPGMSGMAGPSSEFEPHTHLIAPPAAFQKSAVAQHDLPLTLRGDLK